MVFFNEIIESSLNSLFENSIAFKLIILWGERGNGKTFSAHSFLNAKNIKYKDIIFSEENIVLFDLDTNIEFSFYDEDAVLIQCSQLFSEDYCLFFQNMEVCDLDSQRVLYRLLKYHKDNKQKACIILEYNTLDKPVDILSTLTNNIVFLDTPNPDCFFRYYMECFCKNKETYNIFQWALQITQRNLQNFLTTLRLLQYMDILHKNGEQLVYNESSTYKLPDNLLELYVDLFDNLKEYMREPLVSSAPFSKQIYNVLIHAIYNNYDRFEEYLRVLCKQGCFIHEIPENSNKNFEYFQAQYVFSNEYARKAVITRINPEKAEEIVIKYYTHLDRLYNNKRIYNNLQNTDKILLLSKLTQKRQNTLKINQIYYISELMQYYYEKFMYLNTIKQGETLLENQIINPLQLNSISHQFWVIYFKALLAVGEYEKILGYRGQFEDNDLNYDIAVALYNYGCPVEALEVLEKDIDKTSDYQGYVHLLSASIYDWLGNNKKSIDEFKKAIPYCTDDNLKYQMYKKYSMYIDFRIPECRDKLSEAIKYFEFKNLKQYAESLHNYGTGCVLIQDYESAEKYLETSINILNKICSNQIYYPLNSLAILYCHNDCRYKMAKDVIKRALKCDVMETFCELALHNNLFNIAINMKDVDLAKSEKNILEILFKKECNDFKEIAKERSDIQHQLRQFYYNCALFCKLENNFGAALDYFINAKECSNYHSNIIYAIEKNIDDLKEMLKRNNFFSRIRKKKLIPPTELENFIYKRDAYLCEIMFWG